MHEMACTLENLVLEHLRLLLVWSTTLTRLMFTLSSFSHNAISSIEFLVLFSSYNILEKKNLQLCSTFNLIVISVFISLIHTSTRAFFVRQIANDNHNKAYSWYLMSKLIHVTILISPNFYNINFLPLFNLHRSVNFLQQKTLCIL